MGQAGSGIWLGVLGPLHVQHDGTVIQVPAGRQRVVLAALLARAGQVVSFNQMIEIVWDGAPPPEARTTVRGYVKRLRQALGPVVGGRIVTHAPGYLLRAGADEVDLLHFDMLVRSGAAAVRSGNWRQASDVLSKAQSLWRGDPLADIPSETLRREVVPHLVETRLQAAEWRVEAGLHLGLHSELVAELRVLSRQHPLRERFQVQLMLALYRSGRQGEALEAFREARGILVAELGVEPGPDLQRLHEGILAGDPDLAVQPSACSEDVAGSGPAPAARVPRQLPASVRHFAGRTGELKVLSGLLDEAAGVAGSGDRAGTVVITAIGGMAGVGKTALAIHWAHEVADRFPDGQLYVNLRGFDPSGTPVPPAEAIRGLLDGLQVPAASIPADLEAQARLYRSLLAGKRMLVVLDNAREAGQVRPLLPGSPGCLVVVTSRNQMTGMIAAEGARPLTLGVLTEPESRELLARQLGAQRVGREPGAAGKLIGLCANLPLALSIVAARAAAQPYFPLAALTDELQDADSRFDALDAGEATSSVGAVFSWSYRQLSAPAARMFRLLGMHPGPDISVPAAASLGGVPLRRARAALGELTRENLIAEHVPGRYTFHDLLRAYAAERASADEDDTEVRAAVHRMLDHYLLTACAAAAMLNPAFEPLSTPSPQPGVEAEPIASPNQAMAWFNAERPVLLSAIALAAHAGFGSHASFLPHALANFLDRRGHWQDYAATQRTALAAAQRIRSREEQARAHRSLGHAYALIGSYQDALTHVERALGMWRQLGDRVGQARAHHALGWLLDHQGCHEDALCHVQKALALFRAAGNGAGQAEALNSIGWQYARQGNYQQALVWCREAISLHRELGNDLGAAITWDSLAYAHQHLGHHTEAITCYQNCLRLARELGDRNTEAVALSHLGEMHDACGNRAAARETWQQALAILDDLHHPDADQVRARFSDLDCDA
jgi:DNA-binding SARP family transcriptional activator/tetratricopeptide (TPR) repeat protein